MVSRRRTRNFVNAPFAEIEVLCCFPSAVVLFGYLISPHFDRRRTLFIAANRCFSNSSHARASPPNAAVDFGQDKKFSMKYKGVPGVTV